MSRILGIFDVLLQIVMKRLLLALKTSRFFNIRIVIVLVTAFIIISVNIAAIAQRKKIGKNSLTLADSSIAHRVSSGEYQLYFKNINKWNFYTNEKLKDQILVAEKERDLKKALQLIEEYVSNFGIRNFYTDTYLIWKLGQLYEKFGNVSKTKALFRLVHKHHRGDLKKVQSYYDSLTSMDKDYWVPLDYYYKMVDFRKDIDTLNPPETGWHYPGLHALCLT